MTAPCALTEARGRRKPQPDRPLVEPQQSGLAFDRTRRHMSRPIRQCRFGPFAGSASPHFEPDDSSPRDAGQFIRCGLACSTSFSRRNFFCVPRADAGVIGSSDRQFRPWLAAQLSPVRWLRRLSDVSALDPYLAHLCSWLTSTQQRLPPAMLETPSLVLANRPSSLLQGRKLRANLDRQSVPSPMAHAPLLQ